MSQIPKVPTLEEIRSLHSKDRGLLLILDLKAGNMVSFGASAYKYATEPKDDAHRGYLYIRQKNKAYGVIESSDCQDYELKVGINDWMGVEDYIEWWKLQTVEDEMRIKVGRSLIAAIEGKATTEEAYSTIIKNHEVRTSISEVRSKIRSSRRSAFSG